MTASRMATVWALIGGVGTRGISFLFFLLITARLSPAEVGVMAIGLAFGAMLDAFNELGLVEQMVRQPDHGTALVSSVFWLQMIVASVGAMLLTAFSTVIAGFYGEPDLPLVMLGIAVGCVATASTFVPRSLLLRRLAFKEIAIRNTAAALLGGVVGLWMAAEGQGVESLVVMYLVNIFVGALATWWTAAWRPRWVWSRAELTDALRLSKHTLGSRMVESMTSRMDQLVIGSIFGAAALGLYALAMRFFDVMFNAVSMQISSVMLGKLSRVVSDPVAVRQAYYEELKLAATIGVPMFLVSAAFLPPLLTWTLGDKWAGVAPYVHIILSVGAILSFSFSHSLLFTVTGHPHINFMVSLLSMVVWLVALLLLASQAPIFAAVIWAIKMLSEIPVQLYFIRKINSVSLMGYLRACREVLVFTLAFGCGLLVIDHLNWMSPADHPFGFFSGLAAFAVGTLLMWGKQYRQSRAPVSQVE